MGAAGEGENAADGVIDVTDRAGLLPVAGDNSSAGRALGEIQSSLQHARSVGARPTFFLVVPVLREAAILTEAVTRWIQP
jgi:hypothetical protein